MRTHAKAVLIGSALGFALIATSVVAQENNTGAAYSSPPASSTPAVPPAGLSPAAPNSAATSTRAAPDEENVTANPPDNVFIVSPPIGRNWFGAPIVDVSISRGIRTDDLNLRTDDGVRQLRGRVFAAAGALCRWMNAMYPIDQNRNSGPWLQASGCYRDAVRNAMKQADSAINAARGYGGH
jgi:UrcA family protein